MSGSNSAKAQEKAAGQKTTIHETANHTAAASAPQKGETCPRCGTVYKDDYTCACPDSWENEGGAPRSGH